MLNQTNAVLDHIERILNQDDTKKVMERVVTFKSKLTSMLFEIGDRAPGENGALASARELSVYMTVAKLAVTFPPDISDAQIDRLIAIYKTMVTFIRDEWMKRGVEKRFAAMIAVEEFSKSQVALAE